MTALLVLDFLLSSTVSDVGKCYLIRSTDFPALGTINVVCVFRRPLSLGPYHACFGRWFARQFRGRGAIGGGKSWATATNTKMTWPIALALLLGQFILSTTGWLQKRRTYTYIYVCPGMISENRRRRRRRKIACCSFKLILLLYANAPRRGGGGPL